MKKSHFKVADFRATLFSKSLARTNRFEIQIIPPAILRQGSELVSLYAEQASFPILNVQTKPFKIFGPAYQKPITSDYGGEGTSIIFHIDRDMKIKRFFDNWVHSIIDKDSYTVGWLNEYKGTVVIRQLDEEENVTYEIELVDAFPRNINLLDLNNSATNQTHRLNVMFAYRYWRDLSSTRPSEIPTPIFINRTTSTTAANNSANKPVPSAQPRLADGLDNQNGQEVGAGSLG